MEKKSDFCEGLYRPMLFRILSKAGSADAQGYRSKTGMSGGLVRAQRLLFPDGIDEAAFFQFLNEARIHGIGWIKIFGARVA
jgi:hypothetical protein